MFGIAEEVPRRRGVDMDEDGKEGGEEDEEVTGLQPQPLDADLSHAGASTVNHLSPTLQYGHLK